MATPKHSVVILIRGLPGSGKSYLATELQQALGAADTVMLDPDAIDFTSQAYADHVAACRTEGVDEKLFPYRFLRSQAYAGIEARQVVVWNQAFSNLEIFDKMITRFYEHAAAHDIPLSVLVVEIELDPTRAHARVQERGDAGGHSVSDENFERFVREYRTAADRGYEIVTIQGDSNVTTSARVIAQRAIELATS